MKVSPPTVCVVQSRREFLARLGAGAAAVAVGSFGISVWGRHPSFAAQAPNTGSFGDPVDRTLVIVEMGGGNDGLNMVIPYASNRYYDLRGELAIDELLELDPEVGLHPSLEFVADLYRQGSVAVVEGVGYPEPDLSHFASMSTWWSGYPGSFGGTGWLGRYLDGTVGARDPLAGVTIGPGPAPAMLGDTAFVVSIQDMSGLVPSVPEWIDSDADLMGMWQGFAPSAHDGNTLFDEVRSAIHNTEGAAEEINAVLAGATQASDEAPAPSRRNRTSLATSLSMAAQLALSPTRPRVIYVHGWGDFDTHEGQASRHATMMTDLDSALRGFFAEITLAGAGDRIAVATTSEFGRRPAFNGSGTDHGTASAHLLLGGGMTGGRFGESPGLTNLDARGNLVHTVDYRSLYASLLDDFLAIDHADVLGGTYETLPLFDDAPAHPDPIIPPGMG